MPVTHVNRKRDTYYLHVGRTKTRKRRYWFAKSAEGDLVESIREGYHIPPQSAIVLGLFLTHRHPEFWEEPDQFRPERFLGEVPSSRPRFAYFPFGGGPRVCIGGEFAMIEAQLVLATVIQWYEMDLVADHPVVPDPTFTLRPKFGVKVLLRRRG